MNVSREPAVFVAFFAAVIQVVGDFFAPLTSQQISIVNAVVVAVAGLATAIWVTHDGLVAAILGLAQAVIALAVGFGLDWSSVQQAALMAIVTAFVGMFVRTQVVAPVSVLGNGRHEVA